MVERRRHRMVAHLAEEQQVQAVQLVLMMLLSAAVAEVAHRTVQVETQFMEAEEELVLTKPLVVMGQLVVLRFSAVRVVEAVRVVAVILGVRAEHTTHSAQVVVEEVEQEQTLEQLVHPARVLENAEMALVEAELTVRALEELEALVALPAEEEAEEEDLRQEHQQAGPEEEEKLS